MVKWELSIIIRWGFFGDIVITKRMLFVLLMSIPWSLSWVIQKAALALWFHTLKPARGNPFLSFRRATEQPLNMWCQQHPHSIHFWKGELLTQFDLFIDDFEDKNEKMKSERDFWCVPLPVTAQVHPLTPSCCFSFTLYLLFIAWPHFTSYVAFKYLFVI